MTVQFLYPYADDGHDGRELRYSLRGLDTYFTKPFEVTVVGDYPEWIRGHDVAVYPVERKRDNACKQMNILLNVLHGCRAILADRPETSEIICLDDDYMLLDPTASVIPHSAGTFQAVWQNRNRFTEDDFEWWVESLVQTHTLLTSLGTRNPQWYERHRPFPVDPHKAIKLLSGFENKPPERAPMWRTLYGNFVGWEGRERPMRDVRVSSKWPQGTSWVSTDQKYWAKAEKRLERWLPNPSRFE